MIWASAQLPRSGTDHRVVLSGISWEMYEQLVDELERAGRRLMLTYDSGELEMEMPSEIHELIKRFLADLLTSYFLARNIRFLPLGQTTFKRRPVGKGLEPDDCYYLSNLPNVSQAGDNDPERVPPPDLAIEVEVTVPLLNKIPVYAAIGIPELWQIDDAAQVHVLRLVNGAYTESPASVEIPFFTARALTEWVARRLEGDHFGVLQEFRAELGG